MSGSKSDSKYQWPASALGKPEMTILYDLRKELNMPINRVLAKLVNDKAEEASA